MIKWFIRRTRTYRDLLTKFNIEVGIVEKLRLENRVLRDRLFDYEKAASFHEISKD